jgi:hypothetical protein
MDLASRVFDIVFTANEPSIKLIVFFAYCIIAYFAYHRFNHLEVKFDRYNLSNETRTWTTFLRFHLFAFFYILFIAVLYRILLNYPGIIAAIMKLSPEWEKLYAKLQESFPNRNLLQPIAALILLSVLLFRFGPFGDMDLQIRRRLQRLGSIPGQTNRLITILRDSQLNIPDEFREGLKADSPLLFDPNVQNDVGDIQKHILRGAFLTSQLSKFNRSDSDFYRFYYSNKAEVEALEARFDEVKDEVCQYCDVRHVIETRATGESPSSRNESVLRDAQERLKKAMKRNCITTLDNYLTRVYHLYACAVLYEKKLPRDRVESIEKLGFNLKDVRFKSNPAEAAGQVAEDVSLIAIGVFLAFLVSVILGFVFGWTPKASRKTIVFAWIPMAVLYPTIASLAVLYVRKRISTTRRGFWGAVGWTRYGWPVQSYIFTGLLSGAGCCVALILFGLLDPGDSFVPPGRFWTDNLSEVAVWGSLMGFVTAFGLSAFLDIHWVGIRAAATKATILGALLSTTGYTINYLLLHSGRPPAQKDSTGGFVFLMTICFLIGAILGAYVPESYRRRFDMNGKKLV